MSGMDHQIRKGTNRLELSGFAKGWARSILSIKGEHVMVFNNITRKGAEHIDQIVLTGLIPKCTTRFMRIKVVHKP